MRPVRSNTAGVSEIRGWLRTEPATAMDPTALAEIAAKLAADDPYLWSDPVEVVVAGGRTYVVNGHHRLSSVVDPTSGYKGIIPYRVLTEAEAGAGYGFDPGSDFGTFDGSHSAETP